MQQGVPNMCKQSLMLLALPKNRKEKEVRILTQVCGRQKWAASEKHASLGNGIGYCNTCKEEDPFHKDSHMMTPVEAGKLGGKTVPQDFPGVCPMLKTRSPPACASVTQSQARPSKLRSFKVPDCI